MAPNLQGSLNHIFHELKSKSPEIRNRAAYELLGNVSVAKTGTLRRRTFKCWLIAGRLPTRAVSGILQCSQFTYRSACQRQCGHQRANRGNCCNRSAHTITSRRSKLRHCKVSRIPSKCAQEQRQHRPDVCCASSWASGHPWRCLHSRACRE